MGPAISLLLTLAWPAEVVMPPPVGEAASIVAARSYLGRPYGWGKRGAELDCMGLVFRAWSDATGQSWRTLSVNPTQIVAKRQLGAPVPGLDGVVTAQIPWALLRSGDVIFFLGDQENPNEPAMATLAGVPHWVWHMGLYAGGPWQTFVVGDHYAGQVVETPLRAYLEEHRDVYAGIYVVRP